MHKSALEANIYVSCGNHSTLTRAGGVAGGTTGTGGATPGMPSTGSGERAFLVLLVPLALALAVMGAGVKFAQRGG